MNLPAPTEYSSGSVLVRRVIPLGDVEDAERAVLIAGHAEAGRIRAGLVGKAGTPAAA